MGRVTVRRVSVGLVLAAASLFVATRMLTAAEDNLLGLPSKAVPHGGSVMICGGGELPDEVYDEFVRLAGGRQARLVLIPSAYPYDDRAHIERAFRGWKEYEVASFDFLDTDDPEEADDDEFVAPLKKATGVWIAGGAQGRLVDRYVGRKVQAALQEVVERGGVVAGYSAGAAIMSNTIIRYGSSDGPVLDHGFALLGRTVCDSHFSERNRHTRLLGVLAEHPHLIGLGVDEGAGLIVRGNHLRMLGSGSASVIVSRGAAGPMVIHRMKAGDESDVMLARSPTGGPATVELLASARK